MAEWVWREHQGVQVGRSEDNLWESAFSFHPGTDWTARPVQQAHSYELPGECEDALGTLLLCEESKALNIWVRREWQEQSRNRDDMTKRLSMTRTCDRREGRKEHGRRKMAAREG